LAAIEKHLGQKIEKVTMPDFDYTETLGLQHEVRQGHNVRDFEDLGRPGGFQPQRPKGFKDEDERASVVLLFSPTATEADAVSFQAGREDSGPRGASGGGGGDDRGRRRRRGRGGRDGERRGDRPERGEQGSERRAEASKPERFGGDRNQGERRDNGERRDRHQANASLSATDVLRKASDQKAVVSSDMLDLRPRSESEHEDEDGDDDVRGPQDQAPQERIQGPGPRPNGPQYVSQNGAQNEAGGGNGKRRRRRRGKGGRGPQDQQQAQGQGQGHGQNQDRPYQQGARNDGNAGRGDRQDRDRRPNNRWQNGQGQDNRPTAPKPSLWQRLKSSLGLGSGGGGSLGDKW
jgi:ribonuclease E